MIKKNRRQKGESDKQKAWIKLAEKNFEAKNKHKK